MACEAAASATVATPEDGCVASVMRNMSWGASEAQPLSAAGQIPLPAEDLGGNKDLMQELHVRAATRGS